MILRLNPVSKLCGFLAIFLVVMLISCKELLSDAEGEVSNLKLENDFAMLNNEMDAGVSVTFRLKNIGKRGIIKITPTLSCSEGEWSREQTITLDGGESRDFKYFFHEPSINASNVQASIKVFP